jgi:hypothetical protein
MDYRDCVPHFPLLSGQPDRLLAELLEAQSALTIVAYCLRCWRAHPPTRNTLPSRHHLWAAHEALYDARDIIDRVIEELRIQVAEIPWNIDEKTPYE